MKENVFMWKQVTLRRLFKPVSIIAKLGSRDQRSLFIDCDLNAFRISVLLLSFPNDQKLEKISQRRFPAAGTRCYVDQAAQLDLDLLEHQDLGSELQLKTTYLDFVKLQDYGGTSSYTFVLFYCDFQ